MGLSFFLSSIIAVLSLLVGVIVAHSAKEELKDGKVYFHLLQNILLGVIAFLALYSWNFVIALASAIFVVLFAIHYSKNNYIVYALFGLVFAFNDLVNNAFIFFYGIPAGTLMYMAKDWKKSVLISGAIFLVIANIVFRYI